MASGETPGVSFADVCAFLDDQHEEDPEQAAYASLAPFYPSSQAVPLPGVPSQGAPSQGAPSQGASSALCVDFPPAVKTCVPSSSTTSPPPAENGQGMSHICAWPGCGKGFVSRWTLERHAKNHQPVAPGETEPTPDSFVERRLRERLKSVQVALEKVREKHAQLQKQQEQADAELRDAQQQSQQQQSEMMLLAQKNERMRASLPPAVAERLACCACGETGNGPNGCATSSASGGLVASAGVSLGAGTGLLAAGAAPERLLSTGD